MDLIQCLEARGCHHLLSLIFCRLSSPDLSACSQVSRSWSLLIQELVWANRGVRGRVVSNKQRGAYTCTEQSLGRSELSIIRCKLQTYFYSSYGKIIECGLHLLGPSSVSNIYTLWVLHELEGRLECGEWRLVGRWERLRREEVLCRDKAGAAHISRIIHCSFVYHTTSNIVYLPTRDL